MTVPSNPIKTQPRFSLASTFRAGSDEISRESRTRRIMYSSNMPRLFKLLSVLGLMNPIKTSKAIELALTSKHCMIKYSCKNRIVKTRRTNLSWNKTRWANAKAPLAL